MQSTSSTGPYCFPARTNVRSHSSSSSLRPETQFLSHHFLSPGLGIVRTPGYNRDDFQSSTIQTTTTTTPYSHQKAASLPSFSTHYSAPYTTRPFNFNLSNQHSSNGDQGALAELELRIEHKRNNYQHDDEEERGLAEARRALWDEPVSDPSSLSSPEVVQEDPDPEDQADLSPLPSPFQPCHTTLPPLHSCLRASSRPSTATTCVSRSISPSSSSSSAETFSSVTSSPTQSHSNLHSSVQFSDDPPTLASTYSPIEYPRKGNGPVEKLSIREWGELRDVRGAVGVWSGKVAKWDETNSTSVSPTSSHIAIRLGNSVILDAIGQMTETSPRDGKGSFRGEEKTCCALAGVSTLLH